MYNENMARRKLSEKNIKLYQNINIINYINEIENNFSNIYYKIIPILMTILLFLYLNIKYHNKYYLNVNISYQNKSKLNYNFDLLINKNFTYIKNQILLILLSITDNIYNIILFFTKNNVINFKEFSFFKYIILSIVILLFFFLVF